ncbi:S-ribosylhomocysteine lyase, partial [Bacillus thuringiensis]|uniref:S-ribosylhomocysteine lyase n=1 Tax=Bacillus thuringiensis TaxID=1428 RepID=UPI0028D08682
MLNKFHIPFSQPNKQPIKPHLIHTLQHLLSFNLPKYIHPYPHFHIIHISPIASQTPYYLLLTPTPTLPE